MSPAKRTPTAKKKTRASSETATDREVAVPNETDQIQSASAAPDGEDVERRIRQKAYEIFCSRNGNGGNELDDWLAAEREVRFGQTSTGARASASLDALDEDERPDVAG